jgi:prepilin-type N-terminal cleavage/methylation domain-containing protein
MKVSGGRRAERGGDNGETLIEILVALAILGIGISALLVALATNASTTVVNRDQAHAEAALLGAAEWVKAQPFPACTGGAATTTITAAEVPRATGFVLSYGRAVDFDGTTPCADLARIPVTVTGSGFTLTLDVVMRP